jgi:hypothetical protein
MKIKRRNILGAVMETAQTAHPIMAIVMAGGTMAMVTDMGVPAVAMVVYKCRWIS